MPMDGYECDVSVTRVEMAPATLEPGAELESGQLESSQPSLGPVLIVLALFLAAVIGAAGTTLNSSAGQGPAPAAHTDSHLVVVLTGHVTADQITPRG
jgi:hypothetical protein